MSFRESDHMYMSEKNRQFHFCGLSKRSEFIYIYDVNECRGCVAIQKELTAYKVHYKKYFHIRRVLLRQVPSCLRVA